MAPNLAPIAGNNSNITIRSGDLRGASNSSSGSSGTSSNSSSASSSNSGGSSSTSTKNRFIQKYLIDCKSIYSCIYCRTHLANHDELVSRSFQGNHGRAYLFNSVVNVNCGPAVQRELNTGSHAVADIFCENCETTLGWKYEKAYVETQKYKEGKYIIELAHVVRENKHLELDKKQMFFDRTTRCSNQQQKFQQSNNFNCSVSPPSQSNRWYSQPLPSNINNNRNSTSSEYDCNNTCSNQVNEMLQEQDFDDELMFVFYDDLSSSNLSYPNSLSSSHHNKYRRSLYLDSTPYDWKYYTTTPTSSSAEIDSSNKNIDNGDGNLIDNKKDDNKKNKSIIAATKNNHQSPTAVGFIDLSEPAYSISSSSSTSPSSSNSSFPSSTTCQISNGSSVNNNNSNNKSYQETKNNNINSDVIRDNTNSEQFDIKKDEDEETQFQFEPDRQDSFNTNDIISDSFINTCELKLEIKLEQEKQLKKLSENLKTDSGIETTSIGQSTSSFSFNEKSVIIDDENNSNSKLNSYDKNQANKSSPNSSSNNNNNNNGNNNFLSTLNADLIHNNSISLDDEEFYDCFTDHDITTTTSC